jgi:VPDSG-CTERM motif
LKLWDFLVDETHYSFDHLVLQQGSIVHVGNGGRPWNFRLSGTGEAFISKFAMPAAIGSFFMSGTGTGPQVTFTAIFQAFSEVPDGGSAVALLGIALAGLEGLRRKLCAS